MNGAPSMKTNFLLVLLPVLAASCAQFPAGNAGGPLQPQGVTGPCQVKPFFFLSLRSVPTDLTVRNTGEACTFTLVNYAFQQYLNAALVTMPASNGSATAQLISGNFQALVTYVPRPGFTGPDHFSITLEPNATGVTVNVMVQ